MFASSDRAVFEIKNGDLEEVVLLQLRWLLKWIFLLVCVRVCLHVETGQ